jgi:hypothetical protein
MVDFVQQAVVEMRVVKLVNSKGVKKAQEEMVREEEEEEKEEERAVEQVAH